jgi:thiol-disulfide isomerase/thioredoxin
MWAKYISISIYRANHEVSKYDGPLTADHVIGWASKKLGYGLKYLVDLEGLKEFISQPRTSVLGYFPSVSTVVLDSFRSVARTIDNLPFAYTSESGIGEELNLDSDSVVIHAHGNEIRIASSLEDANELYRVISLRSLPLVSKVNRATLPALLSLNQPILMHFFKDSEPAIELAVSTAVRDSGIVLALADCALPETTDLLEFLGSLECPSMWILEELLNPDSNKFKSKSASLILDFVSLFSQRQLKRFVKSDPVERFTSPHEARVIVGSNWSDFLGLKSDKLILFYVPWCSHCMQAVSLFDDLALDATLIAKMDKSRNDSPGLAVDQYPTIMYISASGGRKRYTGPVQKESLTSWLGTVLDS